MTHTTSDVPEPEQEHRKDGSWASSDESRARMQRQRQKDTKPEMELRRELTKLGMRYRLQQRPEPDLRARLDLMFVSARVVVDVRGCFWHACREHGTHPKSNSSRWEDKLRRNVARDLATVEDLTRRGWHIEVVWEHEDMQVAAARVHSAVHERTSSRRSSRSVSTA